MIDFIWQRGYGQSRKLHQRHYASGIQGGFADALVQYGFTSRDGGPMDKHIRYCLGQLRESEEKVREWWHSVPERKKRYWLSAVAIHRHWKASLRPVRDPSAPRTPTPLEQERATNVELQQQLHAALARLRSADGGNLFDLEHDSAEQIGRTIGSAWRASPSRLDTLIKTLTAELKEIRRLARAARPRQGRDAPTAREGGRRDD